MSEIFTPSNLVDDQNEKTETFERHGSLRETHSNKLAGDQRLRSYKKLLYNGNELEKRLLLVGEAGAGKTTFCKHLTDMWCQMNHTNEECKPQFLQQLEDVTVLKQFQYLFYISCRFAEEKETIFDMINNQLLDDDKMKDVAKYVLKHNPESCFIILDGADEWKGSPTSETGRRGDIAGLPGMAGVDSCVIFITSRPWRFHALSEKTQTIFRRLKLKGIADVNMLVESILQKLELPEPVRSSKDFLKQVEENDMSELMEIPLILLIVLGSWIDDKSFHKLICINYIKMIQTFIRRSKGHAGWSKSENRLRLIPNLEELETKWKQRSNELPSLLLTYKPLHRYAGLFLLLGELAFNLLLGKEEQFLIFSKADLTLYIQADEEIDESVDVCLALGIISKAETTKRGIKKVENYAFCHKTFQEIFAALWLTSGYTNEASKQYRYIENIKNLYSCDLMITFLCTIEPDTGKKFWIDLVKENRIRVINLDKTTMNHQSLQQMSGSLSSFSVLKELKLEHLRCSDHSRGCIPVIDLQKCKQLTNLTLSNLLGVDLLLPKEGARFESLEIHNVTMAHDGLEQLSRSLSSWSCIKQVRLFGVRCSEHTDMCCVPGLDLRKHNELEILFISFSSVEDLLLPMEGTRIRTLWLDKVTMAHHVLEQLSRLLSSWSCIKKLNLHGVRCSEHTDMCCIPGLDLRKHNELEILFIAPSSVEYLLLPMEGTRIRTLSLDKVTMAHHGLEQLSRSLSSWSCIKKLNLHGVRCSEHTDMCCIPILDLRKHNELEILSIVDLSAEDLLLPMERTITRTLSLDKVTMAHHGLDQLSRSLSSWSCIKKLNLHTVRCSEHTDMCCIPILDLRKQSELEILYIVDLSVEDLLLPMERTRIRTLWLDKVTMAHHGLEQLSRSLSSWSYIKEVKLDGVRCSEHTDMCCIPVLDLRKHNELEILYIVDLSVEDLLLPMDGIRIRTLWLDKVTMAHHGLEQLSRSLSSWSCIKELNLDGVRCSEHTDMCCIPILDLRKQSELEILYIVDLSVEDLLLPMEGTRIRTLWLDKVTMAHHGLEQLSRSLSSWSCIKEVKLDGVRCSEHTDMCCIPILDLRKQSELEILYIVDLSVEDLLLPMEGTRIRTLWLDKVTMAHHGLEQLSRSLSSWSCIKELKLDGVRCSEHTDMCCIPILDLRKHNELEILFIVSSSAEDLLLPIDGTRIRTLWLDKVAMAHHGLEQLSRSLSSWSCIKELKLDGVRCSEHTDMCCIPILDLWKHNELEILFIVSSSAEDLLLPIDGTRIRTLWLDKVTMAHFVLEQLSRSLSSWSCIKELKFDGVRCSEHTDMCCIPGLDLRKHNELEILFIAPSSVEYLLLPMEGTRIRKLSLDKVTMAHHGLEQLSRLLSSWSCIQELNLDGVRCSEHTDMCCIPILDLRKQSELEILYIVDLSAKDLLLPMERTRIRTLSLDKVTMAHHGLEQLSRSLSSWSCMKELIFDGVRCSEHTDMCCIPILDLRKQSELEILYIVDLSVEDLLLPMERTRIRTLSLDKVTMAHHGLEQLSRSLSSWSCMKELKLDGVRCSEHTDMCCTPGLDLRKHNELELLCIKVSSVEGLLLPIDGTRIKTLWLDKVTMAHHGLEQLSRSLSSWSCIKKLNLYGVRCSEHTDMCCIPILDLRKQSELEILYIVDLSVEDLLLPFEGTRIRTLWLDKVTMAHHGLEQLSRSLSSWSCIKELKLDGVRCSEHTDMCCIPILDLRKHNELEILFIVSSSAEDLLLPIDGTRIRTLWLDKVTMAHHVLEQLSRSLSSWSCIKKLKFDGVRCSEHTDMCCIPGLDLRKHNELEILFIAPSSVEYLLLHMEGTRIRKLSLDKVTMAHHGLEQLSRSLSSWSCIQELNLDGVRCSEHTDMCCIPILDLRKQSELEKLYIRDLSVEDLLLPMERTRIRTLSLDKVTMAHHGLEQLSRSLSSWSCIKELKLDGVRCSEHTDMCCIPILDLRKHNELEILFIVSSSAEDLLLPTDGTRIKTLWLDKATMAHHGLEQLSRSLSSWSCIKELKLDGVRCSEHTDMCCIPGLDLRKHNELEILFIAPSSVEYLLLPIEGTRIKTLWLDKVTMAHHGLEQLSRSLSSWSCIKKLNLYGVRCSEHTDMCCIPILDLRKQSELEILYIVDLSVEDLLLPMEGTRIRTLWLDKVTMAHHVLEQLSRSLSSWSCIKELKLDGVRCSEHTDMCCIPILDLRKHNELEILSIVSSSAEDLLLPTDGTRIRTLWLDKVTMAHHVLEQLSRSLSSWSCIKKLKFDGVRCSEHTDMCCIPGLDLRKHNELEILFIAPSCVEDLLLPMERTRIRTLSLNKVTMTHHGLDQLSRSLSSWSCIQKLNLYGVRCSEHTDMCCIPILDLRKQSELEILYIVDLSAKDLLLPMERTRIRTLSLDKVTMAHHGLDQLSRSLSSWSCIKKLNLYGVRCSEHTDMCCMPILDLRKHNELELLSIKVSSVEGLLLPIDGTRIKTLWLDKVTMAHHGLEQLSRSLSSWSCIKKLNLYGVRCSEHTDMCCIPILVLRKQSEL